ncbi:MAG: sporulation integral membrane protein YtvI [Clostridia bacterium]|nr:sporulation integral membrane protein YtvI [Clostridia bacterium]
MNLVEKRRQTLINIAFFAVLFIAYYVFLKYAFWITAPFIFAGLLALILQKPVRFISKKTRIKRSIVSVITVLIILGALFSLMFFAGYKLFHEFKDFGGYVIGKLNDLPNTIQSVTNWFVGFIDFLPDKIQASVTEAVTSFTDGFLKAYREEGLAAIDTSAITEKLDVSFISTPLGGIWSTAKKIPAIFTAVLVGIIACFFITADYDNIASLIKSNISEEHEAAIVRCKHLFGDILGKMCKSYLTIIFITFCEVAIGLNVLSFTGVYNGDYIAVISICTALLDILPVFGTGTVLIPWAIISFFSKNIGMGIGLLILYAIITVIRQIVEPRLVSMNIGVPPIVTLAGMYLGIQIFGFAGLFAVPITIFFVKTLNDEGIIHFWGRDNKAKFEEKIKNKSKSAPPEKEIAKK